MCQGFWMCQCFCMRQGFWMRQCFCMRQSFEYANVFVYICGRLNFCVFYLHSYLVCANNLLVQIFWDF
jgi:hypothetical protein